MKRWLYGWMTHWRLMRMALAKKHGKPYRLRDAWKCASCGRWIVDGQHRGKPEPITGLIIPKWMREAQR